MTNERHQRVNTTLTEDMRSGYILSMIQKYPNLREINQDEIPGFGPILRGLVGFKSDLNLPERGEYPKEFGSCFSGLSHIHFDLDTGILDYYKRDGSSSVNIDLMDRDYIFVDCEHDAVFKDLIKLYDRSNKDHKGFYDFFEKEEYVNCSLFDILAGRAERSPRVMMPNHTDRGKIKIMEDVLKEYCNQLKRGSELVEARETTDLYWKQFRPIYERRGSLTKKAYQLISERIDAGTIYEDIHNERVEYSRVFGKDYDNQSFYRTKMELKENCHISGQVWFPYEIIPWEQRRPK